MPFLGVKAQILSHMKIKNIHFVIIPLKHLTEYQVICTSRLEAPVPGTWDQRGVMLPCWSNYCTGAAPLLHYIMVTLLHYIMVTLHLNCLLIGLITRRKGGLGAELPGVLDIKPQNNTFIKSHLANAITYSNLNMLDASYVCWQCWVY